MVTDCDELVPVPVTGETKFASNGLAMLTPLVPKAMIIKVVLLAKVTVIVRDAAVGAIAYHVSTLSLEPSVTSPLLLHVSAVPLLVIEDTLFVPSIETIT